MQRFASFLMVVFASIDIGGAAEPRVPASLVGRWNAVEIQNQGKVQAIEDIQPVFEFNHSQLIMHIDRRTAEPSHVFDCFAETSGESLKLDLKSAANTPGPERTIHVRAIYKIEGDTLWICAGHAADAKTPGKRPTKFVSSRESKTDLYVLRRVHVNR